LDIEIISEQRYYLQKVSRYLNYELSTSLLCFLSYNWSITLFLAIIASTIFAPFMLYIFYRIRKFSWIISFLIVVVVPIIICLILGLKLGYLSAFILIPLGFFYLYCFIIKLMINDQLKEMASREELKRKRSEKQKEQELWQKQFHK